MKKDGNYGLSTYDSLGILHDDIATILQERAAFQQHWWKHCPQVFEHTNRHSPLSWATFTITILLGIILIVFSFDQVSEDNYFLEGIFLILIGLGNAFLVIWDNELRLSEIPTLLENLLHFIKECQEKCNWVADNYPHLCSPYSPCITLQWTYRDHKLVNLPYALLVRGDIIVLRPGQPAPADCISQEDGHPLSSGEVYSPPKKRENITLPTARTPLPNKRYILQETPILKNLKETLDSVKRYSVTQFDKQRYLITVTVPLHFIAPATLVLLIFVNSVRYLYIGSGLHWSTLFIIEPVAVIIPAIPLLLPVAWLFLNTLGYAKTSAFLQSSCSSSDLVESGDPFEEISIQEEGLEDFGVGLQWFQHMVHTLRGCQHHLTLARTVNPLHVFGSVTALCCVDKKGILSWPNPTAEKVFFLRTATAKPSVPSDVGSRQCEGNTTEEEEDEGLSENMDVKLSTPVICNGPEEMSTVSEVLDLTHDSQSPFRLYFDDTTWHQHMGSLKPLGLSILLNTCNMSTHEHYLQFCSHVTCEALFSEDLVPVTNRSSKGFRCLSCLKEVSTLMSNNKCLCELSKQIGFTDDVLKNFKLMEQLSTFRHVEVEAVKRDIRFARSLPLATKLKLPFPHMVSVVTSEVAVPKSIQLFSQATGDITLDCCVDFWDGSTLRVLTPSDRKKVLDFYQRTSLTAYCTAFAYRPLNRSVNHAVGQLYMELPADSHGLYLRTRSPTAINTNSLPMSQSIDSLFGADLFDDDVSDIEGCFEVQCNQIFLGMVTMQYQAQSEMVQLIEQLERACIRFVHFSKENELRSRVFSEKMGLESGWNCHISLLKSDPEEEKDETTDEKKDLIPTPVRRSSLGGSKNMSVSAPGAINLELNRSHKGSCTRSSIGDDVELGLLHDAWQSVSCLTDSTDQSAPVNFDMSNRAKLPRGIEEIRPHLELVDNVPLLVSLFTDCTPATTSQMIEIMQDYGEVVVVLGSSANADNCSIFLKANASIAVEPMYPQVCQKVSVYKPTEDCPSPIHLGQRLNSIPCSVSMMRQKPVSVFQLIMHCRHYMLCFSSCLQFWVCSCMLISFLLLLSSILLLPPVLTLGQVMWICCVIIPVLAVSLVFTPTSPKVMLTPGYKFQTSINYEVMAFVAWCYGCKFLFTLLSVPVFFTLFLTSNCPYNVANYTCHPLNPLDYYQNPLPDIKLYTNALLTAQHCATFLIVLHLVTISISFVHRNKLSWNRKPFQNTVWFWICICLTILQTLILTTVFLRETDYEVKIAWYSGLLALLSPIIVFLLNEVVKRQEIKANIRYEKRARLEFGTKLGMNSPF